MIRNSILNHGLMLLKLAAALTSMNACVLTGKRTKAPGQNPPDNKLPRTIEEIIAKYAADANLFRLGPTNPKKNQPLVFFVFYTGGF